MPMACPSNPSKGFISQSNSSTSALLAGATFTGTAQDTYNNPSVTVAVRTDQAGLLYVDFSTDGINWDSTLNYIVDANSPEQHRLAVLRRFFRVRFTNTSASLVVTVPTGCSITVIYR